MSESEAVFAACCAIRSEHGIPVDSDLIAKVRTALRAAAPHIMATGWEVGVQAGLDWDKRYPGDIRAENPYM